MIEIKEVIEPKPLTEKCLTIHPKFFQEEWEQIKDLKEMKCAEYCTDGKYHKVILTGEDLEEQKKHIKEMAEIEEKEMANANTN